VSHCAPLPLGWRVAVFRQRAVANGLLYRLPAAARRADRLLASLRSRHDMIDLDVAWP
jgi:hypothetical protein